MTIGELGLKVRRPPLRMAATRIVDLGERGVIVAAFGETVLDIIEGSAGRLTEASWEEMEERIASSP